MVDMQHGGGLAHPWPGMLGLGRAAEPKREALLSKTVRDG
jgi:hypothetical protein